MLVNEEEILLSGIRDTHLSPSPTPGHCILKHSLWGEPCLPFFSPRTLEVMWLSCIWVLSCMCVAFGCIIFMAQMQPGGAFYSARGLWITVIWTKSMRGGGASPWVVFCPWHLYTFLWPPVAHPSQCADEVLVLTAAGWREMWVKVLVSNEHEKEQEISQVKELLDMAGLEGRVLFYACKLLLEGHLKCVSRIPKRSGSLLSPVAFWRWESEY